MFNTSHIIYIIVALVGTAGVMVGLSFIRPQRWKDFVLKFCALATFIIHISIMWVDYLKYGHAEAPWYILFPIYFCNYCMYVLMVVAFMKNKEGKAFNWLATFIAYGGAIGALITVFYSDYLAADPYMQQWITVKSLLSHNTMLIGCLFLFVGGYVKIRVSNLYKFFAGLVGSLIVGFAVIGLFAAFGLELPNAMYLLDTAIGGVPLFNGYFIGLLMLILVFTFAAIYEQFAVPKGQRWYNEIAAFTQRLKKGKAEDIPEAL